MKKENAIELKNISKSYKLYHNKKDRVKEAFHPLKKKFHKDFYALKDINLSIPRGGILGIVGANGSGKSTLLKVICGVLRPNTGTVKTSGSIVPLLELGAGFNPNFTGLENIYFYSSILGHSPEFMDKCLDEIISFADIGDFIDQPVKTYSSGMRARLAFSVSVNVNPDILILDEILSVGDELFRKRCFNKMNEFFESGKTILFVSHNISTILQLCNSAIFINKGQVLMHGSPKSITNCYNKFLFSKPEDKTKLIESLATDTWKEDNKHNNAGESASPRPKNEKISPQEDKARNENNITHKPYFMSEYVSKTLQENRHYNVDILDYELKTIKGAKVNHLVIGKKYMISCRVRFHDSFEGLKFGMTIKTEKHIKAIGGIAEPEYSVSANDEILVEWSFDCMLNTGIYYITLSAWADIDEIHRPLNQLVECIVFKVLDHEFVHFGKDAIVYLNQKCKLTRLTANT